MSRKKDFAVGYDRSTDNEVNDPYRLSKNKLAMFKISEPEPNSFLFGISQQTAQIC